MLCIIHTKIMMLMLVVIENVKIIGPGVFIETLGVSTEMVGVFIEMACVFTGYPFLQS